MACLKDMTNREVAELKVAYYIRKGLNFVTGKKSPAHIVKLESENWYEMFWLGQCLSREQDKLFTTREEAEKALEERR